MSRVDRKLCQAVEAFAFLSLWIKKARIVCFCSDPGEQLLSEDTSLPGDR